MLFWLFFVLFIPLPILAFTASEAVNHNAPEINISQSEFDALLLDITIPSGKAGQSDVLEALTIQNEGTVKNQEDIARLILWQDKGEAGFQGMGIDEKIGELIFYAPNYSWRLSGLNTAVPASGLRIFVSVETTQGISNYRFFQMKLSGLLDSNNNKRWDMGDLGVFLESGNNGPSDSAVVNPASQTARRFSLDYSAPKAVIISPQANELIAHSAYLIKGRVRDQGGSGIKSLEIGIKKDGQDEVWQTAQVGQVEGLEYPWQFNWQNIVEGNYTLRVRAADFNFGDGISERQVKAAVVFSEIEPAPEPPNQSSTSSDGALNSATSSDAGQAEPEPETPSKTEQIASLKEQIAVIQQMIVQLLGQLIALLQAQISGL